MLDYKKDIKFHKEMFLEFDFFFPFQRGRGEGMEGGGQKYKTCDIWRREPYAFRRVLGACRFGRVMFPFSIHRVVDLNSWRGLALFCPLLVN